MDIVETEKGGVVVFSLRGRLDAYASQSVREKLIAAAEGEQASLVVDLARVTFIDPGGLGALVAGMMRARQSGGDLRLAALQPSVRIIFELTRLDQAFEILDDSESAVASFRG